MSRTGVDLGGPYRISPRRWLMLDRKGRICPGGPPIWEIKSIVWLGFCGSNPEPEEARASSCQQPTCAPRHPPSTVQTRPGSCPLVLRHARTHSRTHSHATDAGAREDHRLGGQLGTYARTTHQPGTLELNPNQAHHLAKPKPNPQGFVRDSGNVVHQLLSCSWPDPLSTTPSALHLSVPTTDDAGNLVCWIPGLRCMLKQA